MYSNQASWNASRSIRPLLSVRGWLVTTLLLCPAWLQATDIMDIYDVAQQRDAQVLAARANYEAIKEAVPQARSGLLPTASAGGFTENTRRTFPVGGQENNPFLAGQDFNSHGYQTQLRQPLINAESWMNLRTARAQRSSANLNLSSVEQNLIVRVLLAYLDVLRAQDRLDAATSTETAFKRQLEQVQQRFDVGLVAITDVLEAQAAADDASVGRIQADGDRDIFFETLGTLSGTRYDQIERLSTDLPVVYPNPKVEDDWVAEALATNLLLRAAIEQVDAANKTVQARRASHLPTVDALLSYNHFSTGGPAFLGGKINEKAVRLEANVPVFQGGLISSRVRESLARVEEARQNLEDQRRTVIRDTRNLYQRASTDVDRVKARARAVRSSQSALDATRTGYEVGTRNIVDVLQAEQRFVNSQFDYADSRYTYILDLLRLKQAAGTLTVDDLQEVNSYIDETQLVSRISNDVSYNDAPR